LICIKAAFPVTDSLESSADQVEAMPQVCQQFWPCRAVPPEWLWMPIVMPLLAIVLVGVPVASILHRAGRSRWWTLIGFIPLINLIGLWLFAFSRWPAVEDAPTTLRK
jgi:uncharacterized membrane protein YhaH (DUF805 family)